MTAAADTTSPPPSGWAAIRATGILLGSLLRVQPLVCGGMVLTALFAGVQRGLGLFAIGQLVAALTTRDAQSAGVWGGVWAATILAQEALGVLEEQLRIRCTDQAQFMVEERVLRLSGAVPLIAYEDSHFFNLMQRAVDNLGDRLAGLVFEFTDLIRNLGGAIGLIVPLYAINPILVVIVALTAVPGFFIQLRVSHLVHEVLRDHASTDMRLRLLARIMDRREYAAEVRLYQRGQGVAEDWRTARNSRTNDVLSATRTQFRAGYLSEAWQAVGIISIIAVVVVMLLSGQASVGAWAVAVIGTEMATLFVFLVLSTIRGLRERSLFLMDLNLFERVATDKLATRSDGRQGRLTTTSEASHRRDDDGVSRDVGRIVVQNVSFRFPQGPPVIHNVSFSIAPGEKIALVGDNGAGKSTLVRLILGLYDPEEGSVRISGVDTRDMDAAETRPSIAAVFQDFMKWHFTLSENIAIGSPDKRNNADELSKALRRVGVGSDSDRLTEDWDAYIGRSFGTHDPSEGQWQTIALARAVLVDADILILDEPTASLDPIMESQVFRHMIGMAKEQTTLFVTHRLGPARLADRVIVLKAGTICEEGTHEELIRRQGHYARMYAAQASMYQDAQQP